MAHIRIKSIRSTQILAIQIAQTNIKSPQATQVPQTNIKSMEATQLSCFLDMCTVVHMYPMKAHTILILAIQICTKELKLPWLTRTSTRLLDHLAMDLQLRLKGQSMPNHYLKQCTVLLAITDPMNNSQLVSV